ncbi:MAG: secondary thiamine-phosphate synthase enzyme YjbQ [Desulfurococcaceae archaeon]
MKVYHESFAIQTSKRMELVDITQRVEEAVRRSGVREGLALVFVPHATAAVVVNEHEEGLMDDIVRKAEELFEPGSAKWRHNAIDNNAHAHMASALFGQERVLPVSSGRLVRGTWQNIFLFELDGPRSRREVHVVVIGE